MIRQLIISIYALLISITPVFFSGDASIMADIAIVISGALIILLCAGIYRFCLANFHCVCFTPVGSQFICFILLLSKHDIHFSSSIQKLYQYQ